MGMHPCGAKSTPCHPVACQETQVLYSSWGSASSVICKCASTSAQVPANAGLRTFAPVMLRSKLSTFPLKLAGPLSGYPLAYSQRHSVQSTLLAAKQ
eukprot:3004634-Amphidinium_carterae.1